MKNHGCFDGFGLSPARPDAARCGPGGPRCCAADPARTAEIRRNLCRIAEFADLERPTGMGQLEIARNLWQNWKIWKDFRRFAKFRRNRWKDFEVLQILEDFGRSADLDELVLNTPCPEGPADPEALPRNTASVPALGRKRISSQSPAKTHCFRAWVHGPRTRREGQTNWIMT